MRSSYDPLHYTDMSSTVLGRDFTLPDNGVVPDVFLGHDLFESAAFNVEHQTDIRIRGRPYRPNVCPVPSRLYKISLVQ